MKFDGFQPVMRFQAGSTAGLWNGVWRDSQSGEVSLWRLCRYPQGWQGWSLDSPERPLEEQYFRTRSELVQMISTYLLDC